MNRFTEIFIPKNDIIYKSYYWQNQSFKLTLWQILEFRQLLTQYMTKTFISILLQNIKNCLNTSHNSKTNNMLYCSQSQDLAKTVVTNLTKRQFISTTSSTLLHQGPWTHVKLLWSSPQLLWHTMSTLS